MDGTKGRIKERWRDGWKEGRKMAQKSLHILSRQDWWTEAEKKTKLEYYREFKDKSDPTTIVCTNMSRMHRSLLAKLSCRILPLQVKVGRFTNVDREDRLCTIYNAGVVEDEFHFLFSCAPLQIEHSSFYVKHVENLPQFMLMPDAMKIRWLMSKDKIKQFAELLEALYFKRRYIMYKYT